MVSSYRSRDTQLNLVILVNPSSTTATILKILQNRNLAILKTFTKKP